MAFLKPQSPLSKGDDYFYPLTTADQIIMSNGLRMEDMVGKTKTQTITLYQNGWSAQAPYCYSITIKELNDRIPARIYPVYPSDLSLDNKIVYKEELSKITNCERDGMIMTFECWEDVPTIDLVVEVEMSVLYPLEGSIDMSDIEPLLPKLNYSVVGGTTEPSNPTENMIWVNTDTEITKVVFSKYEPKLLLEGMIWIVLGDMSNVNFHTISIQEQYINEIYPLSVKQYINNQWIDKIAKSYQHNVWNEWRKFVDIIKNGITSEIAGSWGSKGTTYNGYGNSNTLTLSQGENYLTFNGGGGYFYTTNNFDLTNYDTLVADAIFRGGNANYSFLCIVPTEGMNDLNQRAAAIAQSLHGSRSEIRMDISNLSGLYKIGVACWASDNINTIYNLWLEGSLN